MRWLIASKIALAALLLCGALFPDVGGFAGKGMAFRLPLFLAPALIVPVWWWFHRERPYPIALDVGLTVPFLLDTAANAVGLYDEFTATDDVLHFVNWFVLIGGITIALAQRDDTVSSPRWLVWVAATGLGGVLIILWEVAEYLVMQAGVAGLSLTYGDTLGDLLLSSAGGALGAAAALRWHTQSLSPRNLTATPARPDGA